MTKQEINSAIVTLEYHRTTLAGEKLTEFEKKERDEAEQLSYLKSKGECCGQFV